jgi:hypothetical protein
MAKRTGSERLLSRNEVYDSEYQTETKGVARPRTSSVTLQKDGSILPVGLNFYGNSHSVDQFDSQQVRAHESTLSSAIIFNPRNKPPYDPSSSFSQAQPIDLVTGDKDLSPVFNHSSQQHHAAEGERGVSLLAINSQSLAKLRTLHTNRDRLIGTRVKLNNQREDYIRQRQHTRSAQRKFLDISKTFVNSVTVGEFLGNISVEDLEQAWDDMQSSTARLNHQEERLKDLEQTVNVFESRLETKEERFYREIFRVAKDTPTPAHSDSNDDSTSEMSSKSSNSTPSAVRLFYRYVREAKILNERLIWLEAEHVKEIGRREHQKELGEDLKCTEREFLERYFRQRAVLIQELFSAREESSRLKQRCQNEQFSIEESTGHTSVWEGLDRSNRVLDSLLHYNAVLGKTFGIATLELLCSGYIDTESRVARWLADIPSHTDLPLAHTLGVMNDCDDRTQLSKSHLSVSGSRSDSQYRLSPSRHSNEQLDRFYGEIPAKRYSDPALSIKYFDGSCTPAILPTETRSEK